ncbi:ferritin-like domain-containing protein [Actinomadura rugatobispora]|uniref:ferritin-like domain-containing protein n=1 Tax=Actinomadura rugatobispora TaxID=1994 RepID=UPI00366B3AE9
MSTISQDIGESLAVPVEGRDITWLRNSLQTAVAVELATIPPYLYGLWSIKDSASEVARYIRRIVLQEMLHMGLACNLLAAAGGRPQVMSAAQSYPAHLPGGIRGELTVYLDGLAAGVNDEQDVVRRVFMEIEMPEHPVAFAPGGEAEQFATIGLFYQAIKDCFHACAGQVPFGGVQMTYWIGSDEMFQIGDMGDVDRAIDIIIHQGEGKPGTPVQDLADAPATVSPAVLAHYYRYKEIWCGRSLRYDESAREWKFDGDPVPRPAVHPLEKMGPGGWPDVPPGLRQKLDDWNAKYKNVLETLEKAWRPPGDSGALDESVGHMFELTGKAEDLIAYQLEQHNPKIYGPEFKPPATTGP